MQLEKGEVHDIEHIPNQELATVFNDVVSVGNNLATLATIQLKAPRMWRQLLIKPKMQQIVVEIWSKSYDAVHWAKYFALSKEVREFYNSYAKWIRFSIGTVTSRLPGLTWEEQKTFVYLQQRRVWDEKQKNASQLLNLMTTIMRQGIFNLNMTWGNVN